MAQTLDEFVVEVKIEIDQFEKEYRKKAETSKHYPLKLDNDNVGLWREFFFGYLNGDGV